MEERKVRWIGSTLLLLGICFLIIGVMREEVQTVLIKAVNICLECIGIG